MFVTSSLFLSAASPYHHHHHCRQCRCQHDSQGHLPPLQAQGLSLILCLQPLCGLDEALSLRSLPCTWPASYPAARWGFERIHIKLPRQGLTFKDIKSRAPLWLKIKSLPPKIGEKRFKGGRDQQNDTQEVGGNQSSLPCLSEMTGGNYWVSGRWRH